MIDVEQPDQLGPVEERCRAQGVEPLLDDRRADVAGPWIVPVVGGEQRAARGGGVGRQRPRRELGDRLEVSLREPAADLRRSATVGPAQEDGGAIAVEEDHRVLHEAAEDPIEVESAADVRGNPAQGVGAMEAMTHLVGAPGRGDDRSDAARDLDEQVGIERRAIAVRVRDDDEGAPRTLIARNRDRDLGIPEGVVAESAVAALDGGQIAGRRAIDGGSQCAVRARQVGQAVGRGGRARDEALAAQLVDRHRAEFTALADDQDCLAQDVIERLGIRGHPAESRHRGEVRPTLDSVPIGRTGRRVGQSFGECGAASAVAAGWVLEPERGFGHVLRRGQEPLQVSHPVASIAAGIDPVVAQATRVAPGAHRVRVNAEQAGSLRHREGGIDRTGGKRARHRLLMEEMSSRRPQPTNLTVLANRTKVPAPRAMDA